MNIQLVQTALDLYGLKETPGAGDNPEIIQMAKDCGIPGYTHDEEPWCSLFMNWVAWKARYQRTGSLAARSWLGIGAIVADPELGDVVIFWRDDPKGPFGHAALFIGHRSGLIYALGGNQGNEVCIEGFNPARVLGYRRLAPMPS